MRRASGWVSLFVVASAFVAGCGGRVDEGTRGCASGASCSQPSASQDAGTPDAAPRRDTGADTSRPRDAGTPDASPQRDAGTPDASAQRDATPPPDATTCAGECCANADCPGSASYPLVCNVTTATCAQCVVDGDCTSPQYAGRVCDTTNGTCIECNADDQCATNRCLNQKCVCSIDSNCGDEGQVCHDGVCDTCVTDADCTSDSPYCAVVVSTGANACAQCRNAADCAAGQTCISGQCAM